MPSDAPEVSAALQLPEPGTELEVLLDRLTPPGALTWRTLSGALPWTKPPGSGRGRPRDALIDEVLARAGVRAEAARSYILDGPFTQVMVYSPKERDRNHGLPARAIEVAAEVDIHGSDLVDISRRLGMTDHLIPVPRTGELQDGDPRSARRYLQRGRMLLGALGVWPWAHVGDWQRARHWWLDPAVVRALLRWHDRAWMAAAERLAFCARPRNAGPAYRAVSIGEHYACRDFRDDLARVHAAAAEAEAARAAKTAPDAKNPPLS